MEQRENLCCPVLTVTQLQSSLVRMVIVSIDTDSSAYISVDIPQLPSTPTVAITSIMVSWMPPPYSPNHYTVSYSCQLLCNSSTMTDGSVTVSSATTHTFSSLAPGSSCTISVVAVYDGIGLSNTVSSTVNTATQGIVIVNA